MAIGDIIRAIRGSSLVGAFILSFCLIDYLAGIYKEANKINYKEIVRKYLKNYKEDYLYAIRCSLVHIYGIGDAMEDVNLDSFQFQHKNPENHRKITNVNGKITYWLNLSNFVSDIIKASYKFFADLEKKTEKELEEYIKRADKVIKIWDPSTGKIYSKPNFGSIDFLFSILDSKEVEEMDWRLLENNIYKLCLEK